MYQDVLVPTDGSDHAERGVEHGIDLADEHDATLHALFVVDENSYGETPALSSYELALDRLAADAEELVERIAADAADRGLETETAVRRGVPNEEILGYAEERDVDAIVMGKRGAAADGESHLGSVTDRVVRRADVPVTPV